MSAGKYNFSRIVRAIFTGAILVQTAIILLCAAVEFSNVSAGFMEHQIPKILFWIYVWIGIGAPSAALGTLIVCLAMPGPRKNLIEEAGWGTWRQAATLCLLNVTAAIPWFYFGGLVFYSAGGNR